MILLLSLLLLILLPSYTHTQQTCPQFGYDNTKPNGPSYWGFLCPAYQTCNGNLQSPIDIGDPSLIVEGDIESLQYNYVNTDNITLYNTGTTIEVYSFLQNN